MLTETQIMFLIGFCYHCCRDVHKKLFISIALFNGLVALTALMPSENVPFHTELPFRTIAEAVLNNAVLIDSKTADTEIRKIYFVQPRVHSSISMIRFEIDMQIRLIIHIVPGDD